jgi:hypothetical protein
VSEFADERLARLNAPINDVTALHGILQDSSRGNFDSVELSLNEDFLKLRDQLSAFFDNRSPDDLLLLYYSGHGILGRGNRLFLATNTSNLDIPRTRSISAHELRQFIDDSRAGRQIVVLDCCHSGAFAEHAKATAPAPAVTSETFSAGDAGLYVLTAADALQFAWDGAELRSGDEAAGVFSRFTSWLVEGLEKGEAAPDDDQITMDALYRYLFRRARSEGSPATPQRFVQGGVGDLVISANPLAGSSQIDPETITALMVENWRTRLGAVTELAHLVREGNSTAARAARLVLQRHLANPKEPELNYRVRDAVSVALGQGEKREEAAREAEEERQRAAAAQQAEEEKRRAETPRLVEEEKRQAEAAEHSEEESRWGNAARQPSMPAAEKLVWYRRRRGQIGLSVGGIAPLLLALTLVARLNSSGARTGVFFFTSVVALLAASTFFAIRSERKWPSYVTAGLNVVLSVAATFGAWADDHSEEVIFIMLWALTFAIEGAAAFLNIWSHRS